MRGRKADTLAPSKAFSNALRMILLALSPIACTFYDMSRMFNDTEGTTYDLPTILQESGNGFVENLRI